MKVVVVVWKCFVELILKFFSNRLLVRFRLLCRDWFCL